MVETMKIKIKVVDMKEIAVKEREVISHIESTVVTITDRLKKMNASFIGLEFRPCDCFDAPPDYMVWHITYPLKRGILSLFFRPTLPTLVTLYGQSVNIAIFSQRFSNSTDRENTKLIITDEAEKLAKKLNVSEGKIEIRYDDLYHGH